jgi:hypothetical protein
MSDKALLSPNRAPCAATFSKGCWARDRSLWRGSPRQQHDQGYDLFVIGAGARLGRSQVEGLIAPRERWDIAGRRLQQLGFG